MTWRDRRHSLTLHWVRSTIGRRQTPHSAVSELPCAPQPVVVFTVASGPFRIFWSPLILNRLHFAGNLSKKSNLALCKFYKYLIPKYIVALGALWHWVTFMILKYIVALVYMGEGGPFSPWSDSWSDSTRPQ